MRIVFDETKSNDLLPPTEQLASAAMLVTTGAGEECDAGLMAVAFPDLIVDETVVDQSSTISSRLLSKRITLADQEPFAPRDLLRAFALRDAGLEISDAELLQRRAKNV